MTRQQQHREWLTALREVGTNLTKWEEDFLDSIEEQLDSGRTLSEKQAHLLERIYADRTP